MPKRTPLPAGLRVKYLRVCVTLDKSHPPWASDIPHLAKTSTELSGLVGGACVNGRH